MGVDHLCVGLDRGSKVLLLGLFAGELNLGVLLLLDAIQSKLFFVQSMHNVVNIVKGVKSQERDLVHSAVLFQVPVGGGGKVDVGLILWTNCFVNEPLEIWGVCFTFRV